MIPKLSLLACCVALAMLAPSATAKPTLDASKSFNAEFQALSDTRFNVNLTKNNALMVWQNMDLAKSDLMTITKADSVIGQASLLNIIRGGPTKIAGDIESKGNINLYIVNPNGITIDTAANIQGFNSVYLGTSLPEASLIDSFKSDAQQAIQIDALPKIKGMGKVAVLGHVTTDNLTINAGQIILADVSGLSDNSLMDLPELELYSSIGRIDIGVDAEAGLDASYMGQTYREYLSENGLKAATPEQISAAETHAAGLFIDHSGQIVIRDAQVFDEIRNNPDKDYWLAQDIDLSDEIILGDIYQPFDFTGTLDGAFNSVTFDVKVTDQGQNFGLFGTLDGATVQNLKLYNPCISMDASYKKNSNAELNIGALAGTITGNTTLKQIAVEDLRLELTDLNSASWVGGLAGQIKGAANLQDITVTYSSNAGELVGLSNLQTGHLGSLLGQTDGAANVQGIVASELKADFAPDYMQVGQSSDFINAVGTDTSGAAVAQWGSSLAEGYTKAEARGEASEAFIKVYDDEGQVTSVMHQSFLKPFFLEDFQFTYDGTTHDYAELTANEYFDFADYLVLDQNAPASAQSNAGTYEYGFTSSQQNMGHHFYFNYAYVGETWDGEGKAERSQRENALHGYGTLQINKKPITVELNDQSYNEGDFPNTSVGAETIKNYGSLGLVAGDAVDDLKLTLNVDQEKQEITGSSDSGNYEVTVVPGKLTEIPKQEPDPEPDPDPDPNPDPKPEPKPDPDLTSDPDPNPDPEPMPEPHPEVRPAPNPDEPALAYDPQVVTQSEAERKCTNCGEHDYQEFGYLSMQRIGALNVNGLDYSLAALASLNNGFVPKAPVDGSDAAALLAKLQPQVVESSTTTERIAASPYTWLTKTTTTTIVAPNAEEAAIMGLNGQGEQAALAMAETDDGTWDESAQVDLAANNVGGSAAQATPNAKAIMPAATATSKAQTIEPTATTS